MRESIDIRRFEPNEWRTYMDLRLRSLAESPDAFGSTLELEQQRILEEWRSRLSAGAMSSTDLPLLAQCDLSPAGLAWARISPTESSVASLFQMWVAPEFRGRGLGTQLLQAAISWARTQKVAALHLGVTVGDTPSMRLYSAAGFQLNGAMQPLREGSHVLAQPMCLRFE
jgi:GNAT superfamily N-acetyltransferase